MTRTDAHPIISLVVAISKNRAIGKDNQLLWHLPEDLKFFKRITSGHTVIMGRKTFESIGRALPNRRNIIISRQADYPAEGAETTTSLSQALELCADETEVFIIGGAEIYRQSLALADKIYQTVVDTEMDADAYFPPLNGEEWQETALGSFDRDDRHPYAFRFVLLERRDS